MLSFLPGFEVARAIPAETITGLITGQYKLHGGVVRWAAGTENAGQIISHLIPASTNLASGTLTTLFSPVPVLSDVINSYQLSSIMKSVGHLTHSVEALQAATQQILQMATGIMVLSGLNLAVSAAGFAFINRKLGALQRQLNELQRDVRAIRYLLELEQRTRLEAAVRDLQNSFEATDPHNRRDLLFHARSVLGPISLTYKALLNEQGKTLEELMIAEEYYSLTSLAHARCTAELGMMDVALREVQDVKAFWQTRARQIASKELLGEHPERFLASDFAASVPTTAVVAWCDFAFGEERGYAWVDELRSKTTPWYTRRLANSLPSWSGRSQMTRETERVIPSMQKLVARNSVFEGYVAQYELLARSGVTPSHLNKELEALGKDAAVGDYIILTEREDV